jgi:outer membrane murein-binding lipoprotein Lpp
MDHSRKWVAGVALTSLLLAGCASTVTEKEQYSGFLPN